MSTRRALTAGTAPHAMPPARSKLSPPAPPAAMVERTALCERVCHGRGAKLILVRAPAGYGKTTVMGQARARLIKDGVHTGWITIDRADNDASRFLRCLGIAVADMLQPGVRTAGSQLPDAVEALSAADAPFVLFLDEFELLREPAAIALVHEIIERLPRRGQLVVGTRNLPELSLARLRARGDLVDIDAEALRFSLDETRAYFRLRRQGGLPADVAAELHHKTEGWIAALWMTSLALDRNEDGSAFVQRFSGSTRAIADYLAEEVFEKQDARVRAFLLRTSVLRNLAAPLCDALVPGANAAGLLEQLHVSGHFLAPLEGEPDTYRYHSLFAEYLRARLGREHPQELPALHLSACDWYEAHGRPVPAIEHALEAGDAGRALKLLALHAQVLLKDGRMRLLARWFQTIPKAQLRQHPRLEAVAIWATCFTRGPQTTMAWLQDAGPLGEGDPHVQASVNALRPLLLGMLDRYDEAFEAGQPQLALLPTGNTFADSVLSNAMACVVSVIGRPQDAHRLLDAARRSQGADGRFNIMYTETLQGILDLTEGRLRLAMARFRLAVGAQRATSYNLHNGNAWAGIVYADGLYETNDLDGAERLLNAYLPLAHDVALPDHMIIGYAMRARLACLRGDLDGAQRALVDLEWAGSSRQLARVVAAAKLERSRLFLLQGNAAAAREELERARDDAMWDKVRALRFPAHDINDFLIASLRWEILAGDPHAALAPLAAELARACDEGRHRRALKLRLLQCLAMDAAGDTDGALTRLGGVLQDAAREGFVRLIADEGACAGRLLQRFRRAAAGQKAAAADPLLGEYLQRLAPAIGAVHETTDEQAPAPAPESELTRKEVRVLELLAAGYSNNAIMETLFVSDSTVRTHVRNIFQKLKAKNRTHAVALARKMQLVA